MSTTVKFSNPNKIFTGLGLKPGGKVHKYFMIRAGDRMKDYVPRREFDRFVLAIDQDRNFEQGYWHWKMKWAAKLYYGMTSSGKQINYTKTPNAKAGPYWDVRMVQDQGEALVREIQSYMRNGHG